MLPAPLSAHSAVLIINASPLMQTVYDFKSDATHIVLEATHCRRAHHRYPSLIVLIVHQQCRLFSVPHVIVPRCCAGSYTEHSHDNHAAGRVEFTTFLPENTQAAVIQPIGNEGVLIAASDTQRGFTRLDQVPDL